MERGNKKVERTEKIEKKRPEKRGEKVLRQNMS